MRMYMTYEDPLILGGFLVITCKCAVVGVPEDVQFTVNKEFSDEPGAASIMTDMRKLAKEEADKRTGQSINLGTTVTFCAPS